MKTKTDPEIQIVQPGPTVEVHLPDGKVLRGPRGATLERFLRTLPDADDPPIVGAVINGELRELTYPMKMDAKVRPVRMSDADGALIYRRSLVFLLETAFDMFSPGYPDRRPFGVFRRLLLPGERASPALAKPSWRRWKSK